MFLVLHSGTNQFGLRIDSIDHTEEIVVKPLAQMLSKFSYYAGSSILGDSDVAMVLSANESAKATTHNHELESQLQNQLSLEETQLIDMQEKQDLLVFRYAADEQLAILFSLVFKVEQIDLDSIQSIAENHFIDIEGRNTLLLFLDQHLKLKPLPEDLKTYYIIVPKIDDFHVGIVASTIEESVHMSAQSRLSSSRRYGDFGNHSNQGENHLPDRLVQSCRKVSPERFKSHRKLCNPERDRRLLLKTHLSSEIWKGTTSNQLGLE